MTSQLPERPNLEQLKNQAKTLLRAAHAPDPAVLLAGRTRFRALPEFASKSAAELAALPLALHDAQSVIAREHGFDSWNALREEVEVRTLSFAAAVDDFVRCATGEARGRAERLLALHPGIARANFFTALVLGDVTAVGNALQKNPALATVAGGAQNWEPLHYVCHTCLHRENPARTEGLVAIARRLLALGANPNSRFPWLHHGVRRPVLWGAACWMRLLPLARSLLEAGALPNDGVTLALAASHGDVPALDLLLAHGVDVNGPWATDGSATLYAILHWAGKPDGIHWLLAHGANPDPVFAANGETPLHVVARKWDVAMAEQLVRRGADIGRRRADGRTPYAVAELNGNRAVADWLLAHGASAELPEVDRFVAACSRGDRATAEAMLAARTAMRAEISGEHYVALQQAVERNDSGALETMLACGFDPNFADSEMGATALHWAAMEGWPEAARILLTHGASVTTRDKEFNGQPLAWAAEGSLSVKRKGRDHAAVAKLLLAAGSPTDWKAGAEPAEALLEILDAWRRM